MERYTPALRIAASILRRLRTMPASAISASTFSGPYWTITSGWKLSKALRNASRFFRIVSQDKPAWKPSRVSISKSLRSSCSGRPHSLSWYRRVPRRDDRRVCRNHRRAAVGACAEYRGDQLPQGWRLGCGNQVVWQTTRMGLVGKRR